LLASLALTAWWASGGPALRVRRSGALPWVLLVPLVLTTTLGVSGAIAALGDTLFPSASLAAGLAQDLSPAAHVFVRLRAIHPALALVTGVVVVATTGVVRAMCPTERVRSVARVVVFLFVLQLTAGVVNLVLLAPVATQLIHLVLADVVWIALVLLAAAALAEPSPLPASSSEEAAAAE
jgi:heme A synthase